MPTQNQSMLIDTIATTVGEKGRSDTQRLKSAYGEHNNSVMDPTKAAISFETGAGAEVKPVMLHRTAYRSSYESDVKSGTKHIAGSDFPSEDAPSGTASMDYKNAPRIGATGPVPEGESAPGQPGSTIVASGLGPNVNIHGTLGAGGSRAVVDGSTPGSSAVIDPAHAADGTQSPSATSSALAAETSMPPGSTYGHSTGGNPPAPNPPAPGGGGA